MSTPLPRGHRTVIGRLESADRARVSSYGNPTWRIVIDGKTYTTQTNAAVGYEIGNYRVGRRVQITTTASGRVYAIRYAD